MTEVAKELQELKEKLADIEHQRWADWQKWVHSKCVESSLNGGDGSYVSFPAELFRAWEKQINTPYAELSDREKASDMEQVDRYWPLIESYLSLELDKQKQEKIKSSQSFCGCPMCLHHSEAYELSLSQSPVEDLE